MHVLIRYEKEGRKEGRKKEASKVKQTTIEAKQHSTPKAVTFPKKNELPRVGHVHTCIHSPVLDWYQILTKWSSRLAVANIAPSGEKFRCTAGRASVHLHISPHTPSPPPPSPPPPVTDSCSGVERVSMSEYVHRVTCSPPTSSCRPSLFQERERTG